MNDVRHGTALIDDILAKYRRAWDQKGGFNAPNGQFWTFVFEQQDVTIEADGPSSAWTSAFMIAWNSEQVKASYEAASLGFITNIDGRGFEFQPGPGRIGLWVFIQVVTD